MQAVCTWFGRAAGQEKGDAVLSTWMVVEDEPEIYEVLLAMFGVWGIEGIAFVDGEEAVAWIDDVDNKRFVGELPELALIDIRLPGDIEGPEVGERLRRSPTLRHMAIILITAYKLAADVENTLMQQAGADSVIYKPLPGFGEFKPLLEDVLAKRRAINEQAASEQPPDEQKKPAAEKSASDDKKPAAKPATPAQPKPRRIFRRRTAQSKSSGSAAGRKLADKTGDAVTTNARDDKHGTDKPKQDKD